MKKIKRVKMMNRKTKIFLCLASVIVLSLSIASAYGNAASFKFTSDNIPNNIHLSFKSDPSTSMTIVWETSTPAGSFVQYGVDQHYKMEMAAKGGKRSSFLHEVDLIGLESNTTYHYRCGSEDGWSPDHTFKTAPLEDDNISFIVMGDSRNDPGKLNFDGWKRVADAAASEGFDFTIFSGDMVFCGFNPLEWKAFFDSAHRLMLKAPFMAVLGNHEFYSPLYFTLFATPDAKNKGWYSFNYGNVHVVVLNTETSLLTSIKPNLFPADMGPDSEQYRWLEDDLSNLPDDMWKVVVFHRPPYSCGKVHGDQTDVQPITELFDEYNVDLVFCGHEHGYQRSKPMVNGKVTEGKGTIYVISAGAGAPLYPLNKGDERFSYAESCHHYTLVEVDGNVLTLRAKYPEGEVFDSLTLNRGM